jgi:transposase-like protein
LSFDFIFESLRKRVFYSPIPTPRVIISDQAAGLKASMPISLPNSILQFCDWHAVKNVEKRLAEKGYSQKIRKKMKSLLWAFIKSYTYKDLEAIRAEIHSKLRPDDVQYLRDY